MMEILRFALKVLIVAMIAAPFAVAVGYCWIQKYLSLKVGVQAKLMNAVAEEVKKQVQKKAG